MTRVLTAALLVLPAFLLGGCQSEYRPGVVQVTEGPQGISLASVQRDGQLVYAYAWPRDIPKLDTNDPSLKPAAEGIHFLHASHDGLWFNGQKVVRPAGVKVVALRSDGTVVPIDLTDTEVGQIAKLTQPSGSSGTVPDGPLREKLVAPFQDAASEP